MMYIRNLSLTAALLIIGVSLAGCSDDSSGRRTAEDTGIDAGTTDSGTSDISSGDTDGSCQHNDDCSAGPNQNGFCDPSLKSCVYSCDEGFENCDNDVATGCEVDLRSDINNCGTCGTVCELTAQKLMPICTGGATPTCDVDPDECADGYVNLDGNLGCECEITDPNDPIDDAGTDANCDGVDGVLIDSIFVSESTGDDNTNDGLTPGAPLATLNAALQAASDEGRHHILLAGGDYKGAIELKNGVSIYGGFKAEGFSRDLSKRTRILAEDADFDATTTTYITVRAEDIDQPTTLANLSIEGFKADNAGASTQALFARNSPGLIVQNSTIVGGVAAAGEDGTSGETIDCAPAPAGGRGGQVDVHPDRVKKPCTEPGYDGLENELGLSGALSTPPNGAGGAGGRHHCRPLLTTERAGDGEKGNNGTDGTPGTTGELPVEGAIGSFNTSGVWTPIIGVEPGDGKNGGGGGGGGAGGNFEALIEVAGLPIPSNFAPGGNGGDGGNGGCAGRAATNGMPGGSSFGVVVVGEGLTITTTTIAMGKGGAGGEGGVGGLGETGPLADPGSMVPGSAGNGGNGGTGGDGGPGGNGAGGQGGNAIGLATFDATVDSDTIHFDNTDALKGSGGAATSPAEKGRDGVLEAEQDFGTTN